jgi:hypothetical protein
MLTGMKVRVMMTVIGPATHLFVYGTFSGALFGPFLVRLAIIV